MPDKLITEVQFARLLGAGSHNVELVLAVPRSYRSGHDLPRSYQRWCDTTLPHRLDGLIVTGAPLEYAFDAARHFLEAPAQLCW